MNEFVSSLAKITSNYTVFEKDQILTESQLNSITGYLDPQDRLTRVNLFGVGIVAGLRVRRASGRVHLSEGLGVTTDGDLICENKTISFSAFRKYDQDAPVYKPLYKSETEMFDAWELVRVGETADDTKQLSEFTAVTGKNLANLIAVLVVESYVKDEDFCRLDECENIGKDRLCTVKLLVMESASLAKLKHKFPDAAAGVAGLSAIATQRAILRPATNSLAKLNTVYRAACKEMHADLLRQLPSLSKFYQPLLEDAISNSAMQEWKERLEKYVAVFSGNHLGIQYYHQFLCDVIAVWNDICCKAPLCFTQGCPDIDAFPKHLILGGLNSKSADLHRFDFYPAVTDKNSSGEQEFVFLVQKLDALIANFLAKDIIVGRDVRITPDIQLCDCACGGAIPFYYRGSSSRPVNQFWNFALSQRGKANLNYGYRAEEYNAIPPAAKPLLGNINNCDFFRIEGHISEKLNTVLPILEKQISEHALPFNVRTAYLGVNKKRLIKKKGIRYNDLHRFHRLIREDISHQLDEVKKFSDTHKGNINKAINDKIVSNENANSDNTSVRELSNQLNNNIKNNSNLAQRGLKLNYTAFQINTNWQSSLSETMKFAGLYKSDLSKVTKTNFSTPFDGLIDNTRVNWLPWLDNIIKEKDEKEDDRLMLSEFIKEHPGLEHAGGVTRGGTFVLIYDDNGTVIADCMSSYYIPEPEVVEDPVEPELPKPPIRPPFIIDHGILLNPSRNTFFDQKFKVEDEKITAKITDQIDVQKHVISTFKDSFSIYSNSLIKTPGKVPGLGNFGAGGIGIKEGKVGTKADKLRIIGTEHEQLREILKDPELTDSKRELVKIEVLENEQAMVKEIERMAVILSEDKVNVKSGTDGGMALEEMGVTLARLEENPQVRRKAIAAIKRVQRDTPNKGLKVGLTRFLTG